MQSGRSILNTPKQSSSDVYENSLNSMAGNCQCGLRTFLLALELSRPVVRIRLLYYALWLGISYASLRDQSRSFAAHVSNVRAAGGWARSKGHGGDVTY